jgi:glycosyltransferase involved in cell wall biosynthesis
MINSEPQQGEPSPEPLKIMHVIAGSDYGGAETFCLDAIIALHEAGVRQHVICRPHNRFTMALQARQISFETMPFSIADRFWRGRRRIGRAEKTFRPDAVHAWMGRAASFIPGDVDVPVLGWFGGYYKLKRYRSCDFYMGVTKDIVAHIGRESGRPERTFLVHTFGTLEDAAPVDRASLQTPAGAPVVLMLSRMHWKKGIDTLLQAALLLPEVYFWLAGEGPEREKYEKLAQDMKLGGRVRFLGWRTDRAGLLKSADVCVLPSRYEPFGTVIAEAWYSRVPLVATKADGARQYVIEGQDGLLCDIDDAQGLAAQIHRAILNQDLRALLIENGAAKYEAMFSKPVIVRDLVNAYRTMVRTGKIR